MLAYHFENSVGNAALIIISMVLVFLSVIIIGIHSSRLAVKDRQDDYFLIKGFSKLFMSNI